MDSFTERFKRNTKDKQAKLSKAAITQPLERTDSKISNNDFSDRPISGTGPSLVMKCVVVTRDPKGFGLTVSGDNPVYVQSVKEDGPAAKAGVVQGDRILKVNGVKVTDKNHTDVVKLIKADNYVALTLLGPPPSCLNDSPDVESISSASSSSEPLSAQQTPKVGFYDEKLQTIRNMLENEKVEVERIKEEYSKNPDEKLLQDLFQAQKIQEDLEKQLWKVENNRNNNNKQTTRFPATSTNPFEVDYSPTKSDSMDDEVSLRDMGDPIDSGETKKFQAADVQKHSKYSKDFHSNNIHSEIIPENNSSVMVVDETMDLYKDFSPNNPFLNTSLMNSDNGKLNNQSNDQIMNFEDDDDIVAQCDVNHGPFNDLDTLRQRPAFLAVFLNYVIGSKESAEFLFTLAVDGFKQASNTKDLLKLGDSILKSYVLSSAPYKIESEFGTSQSIQSLLSLKNPSEDALRKVFDGLMITANKKIRNQLAVYRMKREQGLGSLFGDEKLQHAASVEQQQTDIRIVDEIIMPTLNEWILKKSSDDVEQARIVIIQEALQAFLNQYGTKRVKKATSRIYSMLKPRPATQSVKSAKIIGNQDSVSDDQNNRKGISNIFTVKSRKRVDVNTDKSKPSTGKRDKSSRPYSHIPVISQEPLKPIKVGDTQSLSSIDFDDRNQAHLKRADKSVESLHSLASISKEVPVPRSKTTPPEDWHSRGRAHTVTIVPSPQFYQPVYNDSSSTPSDDLNFHYADTVDSGATEKSFRRRRDDEKRHSLGSNKSNSDPDKNKVIQAVGIHAASEQPDQPFRHHTLSTTESTLSLNIDDKKAFDNLPSFTDDPEIEIDEAVQQWTDLVPDNVTKNLEKKEIRRQQIINELMLTEKHHVRDLKILEKLFYDRFLSEDIMSVEERQVLFPNLIEILNLHRELNQALIDMKKRDGHVVKEIGDILLNRFDGEGGTIFRNECASYCGNQSSLLSTIKEKAKKEQNFKQFLQEAQKHPVCRRFHLKDFIPLEFQRLTKYPLLLENIAKYTKERKKNKHDQEAEKVRQACNRCREILAFVNQTVKEAEDKQKIFEIQKNLDREPITKLRNPSSTVKEFADINLTARSAIYQGTLTWKISLADKRKEIALHCILYDDVLVLLQKQEDRYVLKCQGPQSDKSTGGSHDPFIRIDSKLIVRNVATDKRAFFTMPTTDTGPQMYEFAASSGNEMKQWMKLLSEAARNRVGVVPVRRAAFFGSSGEEPAGKLVGRAEDNKEADVSSADEYQINEASISPEPSPDTAAILSQLSAKDQEIKECVSTKFKLLAEMLGINESQVESFFELSSIDSNPDPNLLISHSIVCVDKLTKLLNESAMPKSSFVKSRNQSHADIQSLNRLSVDEPETGYHTDSGPMSPNERWADPVPHPSTSGQSPEESTSEVLEDEVKPDNNNVEETMESDEETSNDVQDVSLDNLESPAAENIEEELSESSEATIENDDFHDALEDTEAVAEPELSTIVEEQSENNEETSEEIGSDSITDNAIKSDTVSIDSVEPNDNTEASVQSDSENNTEPMESTEKTEQIEPEAVASQSTTASDDASEPTKSRPISEIEICSQNSHVPVSKLMEIALQLQTQLTQLMQINEEKESELKQLQQDNKELKAKLESTSSTSVSSHLPSYDEAISEGSGDLCMTTSGSIMQDGTTVHSSLSRHSKLVNSVAHVAAGRSTGF